MAHRHDAVSAWRDEPPKSGSSPLGEAIEDCVAACVGCHATCVQTVLHCIARDGSRTHARHIQTLLDCAELCQMAVRFMFANSAFQSRVCALCADACRACEAACRASGDPHDLRCAEACVCCADMLHRAYTALDASRSLADGW